MNGLFPEPIDRRAALPAVQLLRTLFVAAAAALFFVWATHS